MASSKKNPFSSEQLTRLIDATTGLIEAQSKIVQMGMRNEASKLMGTSAYLLIILFVGSTVLFGLNVAIAIALAQWLGNPLYGVLIVTGFYAIILAVFLFNPEKWQWRISSQIENKIAEVDFQKLAGAESIEASTDGSPVETNKTDEHEQRLEERKKAVD